MSVTMIPAPIVNEVASAVLGCVVAPLLVLFTAAVGAKICQYCADQEERRRSHNASSEEEYEMVSVGEYRALI